MKIAVLGAGVVGSIMSTYLSETKGMEITVFDNNPSHLTPLKKFSLETRRVNLNGKKNLLQAVQDQDLVIGALPGFLGFSTLKTLIEEGKNIADVSFMPENPLSLKDLALKHGCSVIVDMGIAPGMSHFLVGHAVSELDETRDVKIYVGGLPVERKLPFQYKAPFSPIDVMEEYIRPARFVSNGHTLSVPPLTGVEHLEFPGIGTLEAFFTDGLRTLLYTMDVPNMVEKTLRYPGHAEAINVLKSSGFLSDKLVDTGEGNVRPIDLTAALLIEEWRLDPDENEFTVLRVEISGLKDGRRTSYCYHLTDFTDETTGVSSMARTTGYPCAVAAKLLAEGRIQDPGIIVPEELGKDAGIYQTVMAELETLGLHFEEEITEGT